MVKDTGVPAGYKQTEVGIIPEEWEVKTFGEICKVNQGLQIAIEERLKHPIANSKIYITIQYLNNGKDVEYINNYTNSVCCVEDDLLMTRTGNTGMVVTGVNGVFHNNFFKINFDKKQVDRVYLLYYLKANKTKRIILMKAGTSTIPDLNHNDFYSIRIPLPPTKKEQQAIASALSDMDALITTQEQLIIKKRNIKQGAMQQLITGKKRLPGFSGDWEVKKLGELGELKNGINKGKEDFGFGNSFVNLLDVFGRHKLTQGSSLGLVNSSNAERKIYELRKGDVLFIRSSVKPEGVGLTSVVNDDLKDTVYSGFLIRFRDFGKLNFEYKVYCFNEEGFRKRVIDSSTVSANTNINQNALKNLQIKFPPSIDEQQAIAQILSDMDSEIEALEQERDKYRALKQGMMQELLTGKTRLV